MDYKTRRMLEEGELQSLTTPYGTLIGTPESLAATMALMDQMQSGETPFPKGPNSRLHFEDAAQPPRGFVWGHYFPMAAFFGSVTRFFAKELNPSFGELTLRKLKPASDDQKTRGETINLNGVPHVYEPREVKGSPRVIATILGHDIYALRGNRVQIGEVELDIAYSPAMKELSILLFVDAEKFEIGPFSTEHPMPREDVGSLVAFIGVLAGLTKYEIKNLLGNNYRVPKEHYDHLVKPGVGNGNGKAKVDAVKAPVNAKNGKGPKVVSEESAQEVVEQVPAAD